MPLKFSEIDTSMWAENSLDRATSYLTTNAIIHVTLCGLFATTVAVLISLAGPNDSSRSTDAEPALRQSADSAERPRWSTELNERVGMTQSTKNSPSTPIPHAATPTNNETEPRKSTESDDSPNEYSPPAQRENAGVATSPEVHVGNSTDANSQIATETEPGNGGVISPMRRPAGAAQTNQQVDPQDLAASGSARRADASQRHGNAGKSRFTIYYFIIPAFSFVILTVSANVTNWISQQLTYLEWFGRADGEFEQFLVFEEFLERINVLWMTKSSHDRLKAIILKTLKFYTSIPLRLDNIYCYYFLLYLVTPFLGLLYLDGVYALWPAAPIILLVQLSLIATGLKGYLILDCVKEELRHSLSGRLEPLPSPPAKACAVRDRSEHGNNPVNNTPSSETSNTSTDSEEKTDDN